MGQTDQESNLRRKIKLKQFPRFIRARRCSLQMERTWCHLTFQKVAKYQMRRNAQVKWVVRLVISYHTT